MLICAYASYCNDKIISCVAACRRSLKTVCCFDVNPLAAWSCSVTVVPKTSGVYAILVDMPMLSLKSTGTMSHWGYLDTCISRVTCSGTTCTEQQTRNTYQYCYNTCCGFNYYDPAIMNMVYSCPTDKCVTICVSHGIGQCSSCMSTVSCGKAYIVEL